MALWFERVLEHLSSAWQRILTRLQDSGQCDIPTYALLNIHAPKQISILLSHASQGSATGEQLTMPNPRSVPCNQEESWKCCPTFHCTISTLKIAEACRECLAGTCASAVACICTIECANQVCSEQPVCECLLCAPLQPGWQAIGKFNFRHWVFGLMWVSACMHADIVIHDLQNACGQQPAFSPCLCTGMQMYLQIH